MSFAGNNTLDSRALRRCSFFPLSLTSITIRVLKDNNRSGAERCGVSDKPGRFVIYAIG
jgi:hypothetical protein